MTCEGCTSHGCTLLGIVIQAAVQAQNSFEAKRVLGPSRPSGPRTSRPRWGTTSATVSRWKRSPLDSKVIPPGGGGWGYGGKEYGGTAPPPTDPTPPPRSPRAVFSTSGRCRSGYTGGRYRAGFRPWGNALNAHGSWALSRQLRPKAAAAASCDTTQHGRQR